MRPGPGGGVLVGSEPVPVLLELQESIPPTASAPASSSLSEMRARDERGSALLKWGGKPSGGAKRLLCTCGTKRGAMKLSERDRGRSAEDSVGAGEGFEALFRRHYPRLVQTLCFTTLDREEAADAAQEAFIQLYLDWDRVSRYENPVGWVYRVALNRSRDYRRRSRRLRRLWENNPAVMASAADIVWEPDRAFIQALKGLPDRQRQAVSLHYVAGFSQKETADTMGLSEGTVKSHLYRAREELRKTLEVRL